MKQMIQLMFLFYLLPGCGLKAKETIHDYCIGHLDHYQSYEECYSEISKEQEHKITSKQRLGLALQGMSNGLRQSSQSQPIQKPLTCTTYAHVTTCN